MSSLQPLLTLPSMLFVFSQGLKCLYPPGGGPGAVEVTHLDLPRLDADEFLNDTVIDFYVR